MKTPTEEPDFVRDENGFIMPTVENFYKYCGERKLMGVKCKGCGRNPLAPSRHMPEMFLLQS